jgi:GAF domain-containing protein
MTTPDPDRPLRRPEEPPDEAAAAGPSDDLATDVRHIRSMAAGTEVLDAALRLVTTLASATVEGADGVSVSLERQGRMTTVASSNETVLRMDAHQYRTGEGPCLAAAAEGHRFHIESLAEERRWPTFVPLAVGEGIASILSSPLLAFNRPLGALNIYSNREHAFGGRQQELAALFASQASGILTDARADIPDVELAARIADALVAREVIARAQGVLMARRGIDAEAAAASLYRSARSAETSVRLLAVDIVASTEVDADSDG